MSKRCIFEAFEKGDITLCVNECYLISRNRKKSILMDQLLNIYGNILNTVFPLISSGPQISAAL